MANRRHQIFRSVSSPLADDTETNGGETKVGCVQNYSPCSCEVDLYGKHVSCHFVSVESIRDVFHAVNDPEIYDLFNEFANVNISLPLDFLGNTSVTDAIYFYGYTYYPNLVIDPLAFRASQNSLTKFSVDSFDFGLQKDFNFLNGFNKLEELDFVRIFNFTAFQYLPPLPSLQKLQVVICPEINQIAFPDFSPARLKNLEFLYNELSDQTADKIVANLAVSTSADSLNALDLHSNSLTRIPSQVGSAFPKLKSVDLRNNNILHIPSASFTFAYPLKSLNLITNGLKTIESGAFVGINRLLSEQERIIIRVLLFL